MTASAMLRTMFNYQAWANDEMLQKMRGLDAPQHAQQRHTALRLMNHSYVVGQIFSAHLTGSAHNYATDNTAETPTLPALREAVTVSDRWYLDYVQAATPELLAESVAFGFTDGDKGYMSRLEMLTHVATHAIYHRGEVGRILTQLALPMPWDTFAVYLHASEPARRHMA